MFGGVDAVIIGILDVFLSSAFGFEYLCVVRWRMDLLMDGCLVYGCSCGPPRFRRTDHPSEISNFC